MKLYKLKRISSKTNYSVFAKYGKGGFYRIADKNDNIIEEIDHREFSDKKARYDFLVKKVRNKNINRNFFS